MATSTTTIRTITTTCGAFGPESDRLYSFRSLHDAYVSCRRRKRNTINALRFEASLFDNLVDLSSVLQDGSYRPSRSVCFVAKQPKLREIFAADFRDRVVHHLLVPQIEKIFEPKFIHDSYACRTGKGTHAAVERLKVFMNRATKGGRVPAWFIQLDIRSFFMSIDREILLGILSRHVSDERLMSLARKIVLQDCTKNFVYKGDPCLLKGIPPHKSLFTIPAGKGLPIGNLTSQFFGNVYLNELDQFVKHTLKARHYLRYVDDFILLDTSRERLLELKEKIGIFLNERLALELKPEITLKRVSEGANFLGYIVRPDYVLVRNRVIGNLRARLRSFEEEMVQYNKKISPNPSLPKRGNTHSCHSGLSGIVFYKRQTADSGQAGVTVRRKIPALEKGEATCRQSRSFNPTLEKGGEGGFFHIHLRQEKVWQLRQTLASYLGHFKYANAYKLTRSLFEKYEYLKDVFTINDDGRLIPLYEPPFEPVNMRRQYRWAMEQYPAHCIFFHVGKFCEFYGEQAERYGGFFGLKIAGPLNAPQPCVKITPPPSAPPLKIRGGRGSYDSNHNPRNPQLVQCGFPVRHLKGFKAKALNAGLPYVVVGERGYYTSGLKKRVITEIFRTTELKSYRAKI